MICIKVTIPEEICKIDDELKASNSYLKKCLQTGHANGYFYFISAFLDFASH